MQFLEQENTSIIKLSVVAPCHNEEGNLDLLVERVQSVCSSLVSDNFEIILVNDGSTDGTWERIIYLSKNNTFIRGVNLSRNFGHQLALSAGLKYCTGERILIIDADLQDAPEHLREMMPIMDDGADVVYGKRVIRHGDSFIRSLASKIFYRLLNLLSNIEIPSDTGDFRLINRKVLTTLLSMPEHHRYIRGLISWIGFNQVPFNYERDERTSGKTSYTLKKLISFSLDAITGFSIKPLRLVNIFGSILIVLSGSLLLYLIYLWIFEVILVPGWISLLATTLFIGGIQMIFLGLIGEYIGRIFEQTKQRPLFIVSETIGNDDEED
jgi:polyisoprenyl-phosphate glycosyltransferase